MTLTRDTTYPLNRRRNARSPGRLRQRFGMAIAATLASMLIMATTVTVAPHTVLAQETENFAIVHVTTAQLAGFKAKPGSVISVYDPATGNEVGKTVTNDDGFWSILFAEPFEKGKELSVVISGDNNKAVPVTLNTAPVLPPQINYYKGTEVTGLADSIDTVYMNTQGGPTVQGPVNSDASWDLFYSNALSQGQTVYIHTGDPQGDVSVYDSFFVYGENRPAPPTIESFSNGQASGFSIPEEQVWAFAQSGNLLTLATAKQDGSFTMYGLPTNEPVLFTAKTFNTPGYANSNSIFAVSQQNVSSPVPPVFTQIHVGEITGTEATPGTLVWVYRDNGFSVSKRPGKVQADGTWKVTPDISLNVGDEVYAYSEIDSPPQLTSAANYSKVTADNAQTVKYMPYVNIAIDSSQSISAVNSIFEYSKDVAERIVQKLGNVSALNMGLGQNKNDNIAKHISVYTIYSYGGFSITNSNAQYVSTNGFFDPSIFSGQPTPSFYYYNNKSIDQIVDSIDSLKAQTGKSNNLDGFVWGNQTIYTTTPSSINQSVVGRYSDVKAAMVVSLSDGLDNSSDTVPLTQSFQQNDTCNVAKTTLASQGVTFEPYWVAIDGLNGDTPLQTDFLTSCFKNGTVNTYLQNGDISQTSVENAANAVFNEIVNLGNSVN